MTTSHTLTVPYDVASLMVTPTTKVTSEPRLGIIGLGLGLLGIIMRPTHSANADPTVNPTANTWSHWQHPKATVTVGGNPVTSGMASGEPQPEP